MGSHIILIATAVGVLLALGLALVDHLFFQER
jgi:hypothetical protein